MRGRTLKKREREALTQALAQARGEPDSREAEAALQAAAPQVGRAALALKEIEEERRALRAQAWALGGCSALFVALAYLGYQCRAFLLAKPERWGALVAFGVLAVLAVCCLPIILKPERMNENEA